jgi:hypothetical protein
LSDSPFCFATVGTPNGQYPTTAHAEQGYFGVRAGMIPLTMADFKPTDPEQHFALQRTTQAAETAAAAADAQRKSSEDIKSSNERFYYNLALFSSGTIALSVTFMGYLKSPSKPLVHPHWLITSWVCLMFCATCSLFWVFVYGYYSHYFHDRQTASALREKLEIEAKEYPTIVRGTHNLATRAAFSQKEIEAFQTNRREAADIYKTREKEAERRETFYTHIWRWLGRIAQVNFLIGLGFLLAFAIKNM